MPTTSVAPRRLNGAIPGYALPHVTDGNTTDDTAHWSEFRHRVRLFVASRVAAQTDVDDVVQIVLERAVKKRHELRDEERTTSWLFAIARNGIVDYYRRLGRSREVASELDTEQMEDRDHDADSMRQLIAGCMAPLLELVDEETRRVLIQVDLEGQSMSELAEELGISVSGAKSRAQRARKKLLACLERCCIVSLDAAGRPIDLEPRPSTCVRCPATGHER